MRAASATPSNRAQRDRDGNRQDARAGRQRAVTTDELEVLRHQEDEPEQREERDRHRAARGRERRQAEQAHVDHRVVPASFDEHERQRGKLLLSTCNRIEVYADVARFHRGVEEITSVLARHAGLAVTDLADHLYVHFAEAAAEHLFSVASGLDSMVVGETQILGQLRAAYALCSEVGSVGSVLHELAQSGLRIGKWVHSETGIDRAGASVVSVALDRAETVLGPLAGRRAVIVGAGSMGALTAATLRRRGVTGIVVANRSSQPAARIAASVGGRAISLDDLASELPGVDVLISSTGSTGLVVVTGSLV